MCWLLVSAFFGQITQQIHSLRARGGEVFPRRQSLWVGNQDASQIHRDGMHHSAGDHPAHRSPIVASMRSKVALRSARCRALASSATSSALTPASELRSSSVPETSISPPNVAGAIHEALGQAWRGANDQAAPARPLSTRHLQSPSRSLYGTHITSQRRTAAEREQGARPPALNCVLGARFQRICDPAVTRRRLSYSWKRRF
jgi:hypothetical protein